MEEAGSAGLRSTCQTVLRPVKRPTTTTTNAITSSNQSRLCTNSPPPKAAISKTIKIKSSSGDKGSSCDGVQGSLPEFQIPWPTDV
jgi:hypothetical protein